MTCHNCARTDCPVPANDARWLAGDKFTVTEFNAKCAAERACRAIGALRAQLAEERAMRSRAELTIAQSGQVPQTVATIEEWLKSTPSGRLLWARWDEVETISDERDAAMRARDEAIARAERAEIAHGETRRILRELTRDVKATTQTINASAARIALTPEPPINNPKET